MRKIKAKLHECAHARFPRRRHSAPAVQARAFISFPACPTLKPTLRHACPSPPLGDHCGWAWSRSVPSENHHLSHRHKQLQIHNIHIFVCHQASRRRQCAYQICLIPGKREFGANLGTLRAAASVLAYRRVRPVPGVTPGTGCWADTPTTMRWHSHDVVPSPGQVRDGFLLCSSLRFCRHLGKISRGRPP